MMQAELQFRTWGGRREGAGRKRTGLGGVPYRRRPGFATRMPVHVTWRFAAHVWNLRSRRSLRVIAGALWKGADRGGARVVQLSIQGNHVHLLIEADSTAALTRRMRGLGIAVAKGMNRLMGRRGRVLADRYHEHVLRTPTEVRRAVRYIRDNQRHHHPEVAFSAGYVDPYGSGAPGLSLPPPRSWLVRRATKPPPGA